MRRALRAPGVRRGPHDAHAAPKPSRRPPVAIALRQIGCRYGLLGKQNGQPFQERADIGMSANDIDELLKV